MKVARYITVAVNNPSVFVALTEVDERVRRLISEGWQPLGGISVAGGSQSWCVAQAMVIYEIENNP